MTEPTIRIWPLDVMSVGHWRFGSTTASWAYHRYSGQAEFDPFPAYPHNLATVEQAVSHVLTRQRPLWDIDLYVADREEIGRTNGQSSVYYDYEYDDEGHRTGDRQVLAYILLCGKRIPPHPAMARYLVGHEFGHHIEWMLNRARGARHLQDDDLIREYAAMRGLPSASVHHGAGGNWHDSAAEIFACDFRILCCDVETEFWPHIGVPRPETVDGLDDWWSAAQADLNAAVPTS